MREPSDARKRTIALQERATRFSAAVNTACPKQFRDIPSATVWRQLVRAADSTSNNLGEADDASSTADFVHKMRLALREVKEARHCLVKLRLSSLQGANGVKDLEREADELAAIFATIVLNVLRRVEREQRSRPGHS
jgi:four helix bundle protein